MIELKYVRNHDFTTESAHQLKIYAVKGGLQVSII
jgi:hypothetical protein